MSYYQGDYYPRGDPGLFGFLGKAIGTVAKVGASLIPGPVGAVARAATGAIWKPKITAASPHIMAPPIAPLQRMVSPSGRTQMVAPGSDTYYEGGYRKKRRRMNVTNDKALRRAVRRTDGFVKLAKRALRGTGYTVVSKSSRVKRVNVRESGAGGVTVH